MMHRQDQSDDWQVCPEGTLGGLARRLRAQRQSHSLTRVSLAAGCVTLLAAATVMVAGLQLSENNAGGVTCAEVAPLLSDYRQGRLPEDVAARVAAHLAHCPTCRQAFDKLAGRRVGSAPRWIARAHR